MLLNIVLSITQEFKIKATHFLYVWLASPATHDQPRPGSSSMGYYKIEERHGRMVSRHLVDAGHGLQK